MKGKKGSQNTDLAQKHSDNTQFLSFLHEDFLSKPSSKDARSKLVIDTKELLTHACAQYKALLELPPLVFWSTMQHNAYVNRSLDSFLSFARRWHFSILDLTNPKDNAEYQDDLDYETIQIKKNLYLYFNELYRVILCVYDRLSSDPHDKSITDRIQYSEVIYQNWLFDIPKFLDICSLYYDCDGERVKRILNNVFEVEDAYHDDFLDFIKDLIDNIIPNNLKIINRHRKREDLDAATLSSDTEEKERVLVVLYDIINHLKLICLCFPKKCVEGLYYDKKFLLLLENTYMVLNSCSKTWRVNAEKDSILRNLVRRVNNTIFRVFERVYSNIFGSILLTNKGDKISKDKKLWGTVNDFLNQTGKTMLKKKDDEPNHKFLRKLMRYVDFGAILQKVPEGVLKEEDIQTHQVLLMVLREKTDMLKKKYGPAEEKEEVHVDQASPEKAPLSETAPVEVNPVKEVKLEKKTSVIDKEAESTKEAIRIIEMSMGKKNKTLNIFDEDEVRGAMEATLKLAANTNVYEDEYDDTLEMYEEDRLRVGGDKADENEDDDQEGVNIEGAVKPEEGGKPGGQRGKRGGKVDKGGKNEGQKGGKTYEEKGKGYDKDKQQGGETEGYKYQSNRDDRGGYKGDRYQGDRYQSDRYQGDKYQGDRYQGGDKYQQKGGNYQGDRYQGDKYQGDRYQGDKYQGDRYQGGDRYQQKGGNYQGGGYQGDRYQGNKYEDNRGGKDSGYRGSGGYNKNDKVYQEKNKDSFEEEYKGAEKSRDGGFAAEMQRGGGSGGFDPKKQNRSTYNERRKYKGGGSNTEKEFVPKK